MFTSVQRWMSVAVVLSLLIVGNFVAALSGLCLLGLALISVALLISIGAIGAALLVFAAAIWNWLFGTENRDGPPGDYYYWQGEPSDDEVRR